MVGVLLQDLTQWTIQEKGGGIGYQEIVSTIHVRREEYYTISFEKYLKQAWKKRHRHDAGFERIKKFRQWLVNLHQPSHAPD